MHEQGGAVVEEKDEGLYEVDNGLACITIKVAAGVPAFNEKRPPDFSEFRGKVYPAPEPPVSRRALA